MILAVSVLSTVVAVGVPIDGNAQTIAAQGPTPGVAAPANDANKLAAVAQVLQKLESRQAFTLVSDGKTLKWAAGPKNLTPRPGDATAQHSARMRTIRRLVDALAINTPFVLSVNSLGAECACMCGSVTEHKWDCDPAGCSEKHGTAC